MTLAISTAFPQVVPPVVHNYPHLLVHYGELALKGRNRHRFIQRLIEELRAKCRPLGTCRIRMLQNRIWCAFADAVSWDTLSAIARNTFGIANAHGMWQTLPTLAAIEAQAMACARADNFDSFAVRCRRVEKQGALTSQEVCIRVGRAIELATGARVNLDAPAWTLWVTLVGQDAFVGCNREEGPGGFPVGISGRVACLLSGGIDSPVAAWRMMRRGCRVDFIHFHSAPFTSAASQEKVAELVRLLARWQGIGRLAMVPFGRIQEEIATNAPSAYRIVLYRRLMLRIAESLARAAGCEALVTGESMGQVASQTLSNLAAIDAVATCPVLRPLIGKDKQEIVDEAKRIGTYAVSIEPHSDCCQYLEPRNPATHSSADELSVIEQEMNLAALVAQGIETAAWQTIG
ncbi:MAG: tRNA 4-thiouridine(8) synthase ThiI [Deltaproteobacteria bacterium]|nr:tRNA 4-thiouridine(8) synthase ThiI [Deltaproteobacteria bacterium]